MPLPLSRVQAAPRPRAALSIVREPDPPVQLLDSFRLEVHVGGLSDELAELALARLDAADFRRLLALEARRLLARLGLDADVRIL